MATKQNLKLKPKLTKPDMAPIEKVRDPSFDNAMANQDYFNNLAQALAIFQAQNYPAQVNPNNQTVSNEQQNVNNIYNALRDYKATNYPVSKVQNAGQQFAQFQPQAMQDYNKMFQQGMNTISSINQDTMTNFANMQPGMDVTQPATPVTSKPTMPVAGLGMQKSQAKPTRTFAPTKAF